MIQELFGISGLLTDSRDTKISTNGSINLESSSTSTSLRPPATASAAVTTAVAAAADGQNLRCPRCDSSNTKFCYYNNYNLTQPRHFCKTCRRYWTKGGALRNVPIGGGCRKNKTGSAVGKSSGGKILGRVGFGFNGSGLDRDLNNIISPHTQILWGSPQNSQLLSILRSAARNQNPNPNNKNNSNNLVGCHVINDTPAAAATVGFDPPVNRVSSLSQVFHQQNGYVHGGADQVTGCGGGGIQDLYQKLKLSSGNYYVSNGQQGTAAILEAAPAGGGEMTGCWNPVFSWSDVQASANGAYP